MRFYIQPTLALLTNLSLSIASNTIFGLLSNLPPPVSAASTTSTSPSTSPSSTNSITPSCSSSSSFDPARFSAWPSPGRRTHRPTAAPIPVSPDGPGLPDDFHGYISGRFCPWCWAFIKPSNLTRECNFVIQQMATAYRPGEVDLSPMPWAVLDYNFSRVLDAGVARRHEFVGVTLRDGKGGGFVQYAGNGFLVSSEGGVLPPSFVFNDQRFEPANPEWETYPHIGWDGLATARRIPFVCSREIPCELGGRCSRKEDL